MKYSNQAGALASLALIITCFFPWVKIESINTVVTGMYSGSTNFGKPGIIHIAFSIIAIGFFLMDRIWAKRANVVLCTLNFAWGLKNFLVLSRCEAGDCPQRQAGIFAMLIFASIMLIASLLPKVNSDK